MNRLFVRVGMSVFVALAIAFTGCTGEGGKGTVKGTISVNGVPLKAGLISFVPEAGKGDPFNARIIDGKFEGLEMPYGKARAYVIPDSAAAKQVDQGDVRPAPRQAASTEVPEKYQRLETSGLEIDVKSGENTFDRDLK